MRHPHTIHLHQRKYTCTTYLGESFASPMPPLTMHVTFIPPPTLSLLVMVNNYEAGNSGHRAVAPLTSRRRDLYRYRFLIQLDSRLPETKGEGEVGGRGVVWLPCSLAEAGRVARHRLPQPGVWWPHSAISRGTRRVFWRPSRPRRGWPWHPRPMLLVLMCTS